MQELNASRPNDFFLQQGPDASSPHASALQARATPLDTFVDCTEYTTAVLLPPGGFPSLEDMMCALVNAGHEGGGTLTQTEQMQKPPAVAPAEAADAPPGAITVDSGAPARPPRCAAVALLVATLAGALWAAL
jgi:hypothetical protein